MRVILTHYAKIALAILLIFVGVLGLVLPIIPGVALILLGLVLLGVIEKKHMDELREKLRKKKVYK